MRAPLPRPARGHRRPRSRPLSKAAGLQGACHRGLWNWRHSRPSSRGQHLCLGQREGGGARVGRRAGALLPPPPPLLQHPRASLPLLASLFPRRLLWTSSPSPHLLPWVPHRPQESPWNRWQARGCPSVFSAAARPALYTLSSQKAHEPTRAAVPPCSAALPSPLSRVFPSVSFSSVPTGMSAPGGQTISSRPCPAPPGVGGSGCGAGSGAVQQMSEYLNSRFPALSLSLSPSLLPRGQGSGLWLIPPRPLHCARCPALPTHTGPPSHRPRT